MDLIGRTDELEHLVHRLQGPFASTEVADRLIAVTGPAGIGKTALLDALIPRIDGPVVRFSVRGGTSSTLATTFAPLLGDSHGPSDFTPAVPEIGRGRRSAAESMVVDRILRAVEDRLATDRLTIVIDDVEPSDAIVEVLDGLAALAQHMPLAVVTAGPVVVADGFEAMSLDPLEPAVILELARRRRQTLDAVDERRISIAGGNPLFLEMLLDDDPDAPIPSDLRESIRARLAALDDVALDVIQLVGVLGDVAPDTIATLRGGGLTECLLAIERARAARLLDVDGDTVRFSHDLVREVVSDDLPTALARTLHLHAVRTLPGLDAHARARHLLAGARRGDVAVAGELRVTAGELGVIDPDRAVELLTVALDLAGPSSGEVGIEVDLVMALARAARVDEAMALARSQLPRVAGAREQAKLHAVIGQAMLMRGESSVEAFAHLRAAIESPVESARGRALLLGDAAVAQLLGGDFEGAATTAAEAHALAPELESSGPLCDALCVDALLASFRGDFATALAAARRAVEVVGDDVEVRRRSIPEYFLAFVAVNDRRFDEAAAVCAAGRAALDACGAVWAVPLLHFVAANNRYHQGEWDSALAEIEAGLLLATSIDSVLGVSFGHAIAALIHEARDELTLARGSLDAAGAMANVDTQGADLDTLAVANARLAVARGNSQTALRDLRQAWTFDRMMGLCDDLPDLAIEIAHIAIECDDRESLEWLLDEVEAAVGVHPAGSVVRDWCRALAQRDPDLMMAVTRDLRGVDPRPFVGAVADGDLAIGLARSGRSDLAADALDRSLGAFERLGATRWITRILAAARAAGVVTRRRSSRAASRVGWESLTPTEIDVVRLVVEGLTNRSIGDRLFISHRTVETHLKHVFTKLGLRSRVDLVAAARDRI